MRFFSIWKFSKLYYNVHVRPDFLGNRDFSSDTIKLDFFSSLYFVPSFTLFLLILCFMFFAWTFTIRFWIHGKSIEAFKTACVNLRVQIIVSARRACSLAIYQPKLHRTTFIRPPKKRCSMTENKYKKVYRNDFILLSTNEKSETN